MASVEKWSSNELWEDHDAIKLKNVFETILENNFPGIATDKIRAVFDFNNLHTSFFPDKHINKKQHPTKSSAIEAYILSWISSYENFTPPSKRTPSSRQVPYDAVIYLLVDYLAASGAEDIEEVRHAHENSMQAENVIGSLLEEYIASELADTNWIWVKGSIMAATDFFYPDETQPCLLQVKNKWNTENSSSAAIRKGTDIKKWNRLLNKKVSSTSNEAQANWDELNSLIKECSGIEKTLSEAKFREFIRQVCINNPSVLAVEK